MLTRSPDTSLQLVSKKDFLKVFSIVFLPMLLAAVDQTLLATATPAIVKDLGDMQLASWIMIAYLLATAASVPVYGWLGDRYSRRCRFSSGPCIERRRRRIARARASD